MKSLYVWGSGGTGQLGLGTTDDYTLPQRCKSNEIPYESVQSGGCHSAGIDRNGRLYLWGSNNCGQLGYVKSNQAETFICTPQGSLNGLPHDSRIHFVACGWSHSLVVAYSNSLQSDQVFSFGSNEFYQLGRENSTDEKNTYASRQIFHLPPRLKVASIACGWKHSLLATFEGEVYAWGSGRHGQLGLGNECVQSITPERVVALQGTAIRTVCCGWDHSVFQSSSGAIFTCGNNRHKQLGIASVIAKTSVFVPIGVANPQDQNLPLCVLQVHCGWHFVLCVTTTGELVAWGKNSHGQLGLHTFQNACVPTIVPFSYSIHKIACGSEHSMVVTTSGELYTCGWGEHGNLGHADTINRAILTKLEFFTHLNEKVTKIAAGGAVSMALTEPTDPRISSQ